MPFVLSFTQRLVLLTDLVKLHKISPEHIRVWLRVTDLDLTDEAIPDPSDPEELEMLQLVLDSFLQEFFFHILSMLQLFTESSSFSEDQRDAIQALCTALDQFIIATSARQRQGVNGWVYITVQFMEVAAKGLITPIALDVLLRSTTPTILTHTFDA